MLTPPTLTPRVPTPPCSPGVRSSLPDCWRRLAARAQTTSGNIVRIINPFAAGGTSDAMARLLQPALQQRLGATVIVENRPGASASIGAAVVAKSPPDGTTWLLTSETFLVSTLLLPNLPFDVQKDFEPVTMIARGPMVLCAHPSRPYRTLPELVAAAKAKPGALTYGTTGIGSNGHLTVAALVPAHRHQARACALSGCRAAVE